MIDVEFIFEKSVTIYNESSEFIIQKGSSIFSFSKESKPRINKINKKFTYSTPEKGYGILGVLYGLGTDYLMIISKALLAGLFFKSKICQIIEISFLPFDNKSEDHFKRNKENIKMITDFLYYNALYYSDAYDLTATVLENINRNKLLESTITKSHFCWNYNFISSIKYNYELFDPKENFIYPVINGFISSQDVTGYEKEFNYMVIARRDNRRSGMRFLTRGCNSEGQAANSVESEQIVSFLDVDKYNILSYIQLRGSIPILWSQPSQLQFVPKVKLEQDFSKGVTVFKKHLSELRSVYWRITLINLIDKKGDQKRIGDLFENISNETKDEIDHSFVWFDFHSECKKMRYENLNKLLKKNIVALAMVNNSFTHLCVPSTFSYYDENEENSVNIIMQQTGIFRTNCMDSLDRTNVVQTLFARNVLHQMLNWVKLSKSQSSGEAFEPFNKYLEKVYRGIWADHGDYISKMYSGTPAQKGDFTRLGQRTSMGAAKDFFISGKRFYLANFKDGYRQDCHDYFLGHITPFKFVSRNNLKYLKMFLISLPIMSLLIYFTIHDTLHTIGVNSSSGMLLNIINFIFSFIISAKFLIFSFADKMYDKPSN